MCLNMNLNCTAVLAILMSQMFIFIMVAELLKKFEYIKTVHIYDLKESLDFDWKGNTIRISSDVVENIFEFNLGSDDFLESIKEVQIFYEKLCKSAVDIEKDTKILQIYFKYLDRIDIELWNQFQLMLNFKELIEIIKIPQIFSIKTLFPLGLKKNVIKSTNGCVLFLLPETEYFVNYTQLKISIDESNCRVEGDYLRFEGSFTNLELTSEGLATTSKDYDITDFENIQEPIMLLHKKFIHEFELKSKTRASKIFPTRQIKIDIIDHMTVKVPSLISYLQSFSKK